MGSTALLAFGYVVLFLSNTLSSSAGIGGGLLNVAIIHSIQGFGLKDAVVMSLAAIMGNTLVQLCINIRTRHPSDNKKSVIYWDMVLMMLPAELGGSNLGVILSSVMPSTLMYIGAVIVLMIGGLFTAKKARHLYELENERKQDKGGITDKLMASNPMSNDVSLAADGLANTCETRSGSNASQPGEQQTRFPSLDAYLPEHTRRLGSISGAGNVDRSEDSLLTSPLLPPMQVPWFLIAVIGLVWTCYLSLYVGMTFVPGCSLDWGIILIFVYLIVVVEVPWAYLHLTAQQKSDPHSIVALGPQRAGHPPGDLLHRRADRAVGLRRRRADRALSAAAAHPAPGVHRHLRHDELPQHRAQFNPLRHTG